MAGGNSFYDPVLSTYLYNLAYYFVIRQEQKSNTLDACLAKLDSGMVDADLENQN